jgi:hypothetical protein
MTTTRNYRRGAAIVLAALALASCSTAPQEPESSAMPFEVTPEVVTPGAYPFGSSSSDSSAYPAPAPAVTEPDNGYPAPAEANQGDPYGREMTALDSLTVAQEISRNQFSPEAQLYAIVPSRIMIMNLGSPPVVSGWFYKFKVPGSSRELMVQVVDGKISGTTEVELLEPATPAELPLDLDQIKIDSDQVFASFVEKAPSLGLTVTEPKRYDLELVFLEGQNEPVWSVVDPTTLEWLYTISATTGQEAPNPRS